MSTVQAQRARAGRPLLRHSSFAGGSYLEDHQQYRSGHPDKGIDGVLEDNQIVRATNAVAYLALGESQQGARGRSSPRIKESGIIHGISHRLCQPGPDDAERWVATLFYKSQSPRHPHLHPDSILTQDPFQLPPQPSPPAGIAPTVDLAKFPLEPPPPEPEPLDHLYGPYVTQICLTYFLQILDTLQNPWRRITSSHRCLDDKVHPRVMEVTFSPPPNPDYLSLDDLRKHESLWRFEREWNVEVIVQRDHVWRRHKRLVVFDMDSTLIEQEVIDEIAKAIGVEEEVSVCSDTPFYSLVRLSGSCASDDYGKSHERRVGLHHLSPR